MELHLKLSNLTCQHCVMRIETALLRDGLAESVMIDPVAQLVKVETNADETAICQRITELGYHISKQ